MNLSERSEREGLHQLYLWFCDGFSKIKFLPSFVCVFLNLLCHLCRNPFKNQTKQKPRRKLVLGKRRSQSETIFSKHG